MLYPKDTFNTIHLEHRTTAEDILAYAEEKWGTGVDPRWLEISVVDYYNGGPRKDPESFDKYLKVTLLQTLH
jgi:hypothetical protein